jgi:sodium transport system ATP-binding protein
MIAVQALAKRFKLSKKAKSTVASDAREVAGWYEAVRSVSFQCKAGEILGLIGPNGAGKTTSLRMLSTALTPSGGQVFVDGIDLVKDPVAARRKFGFLSGSTGLYGKLTVRENIRYFGQAYGLTGKALDTRIDDLLKRLDMVSYADRRADALSSGMKQRALIARTVVHAPKLLILDEPTTGLDILGAQIVLDFMRDWQRDGAALVFSTHQLHEVTALCQRVCIIDAGVSVFEDSLDALLAAGDNDLSRGYRSFLGAN